MGTTVLWYSANEICVCHGSNCNSEAAGTQTVRSVCTVPCSREKTDQLIELGSSQGQKWAFPIAVLGRHSFPSCYVIFRGVSVFAAPFTSFLWCDSFANSLLDTSCGQELCMQQLLHLGRDRRAGKGGSFTWEEDRGTSRLTAPLFPLPCSLHCVLTTQWTVWLHPFLFTSLLLHCLVAVSLSQYCIWLLHSSHSSLSAPRKLWDLNRYHKLFLL